VTWTFDCFDYDGENGRFLLGRVECQVFCSNCGLGCPILHHVEGFGCQPTDDLALSR
jgi:hypothetical protein